MSEASPPYGAELPEGEVLNEQDRRRQDQLAAAQRALQTHDGARLLDLLREYTIERSVLDSSTVYGLDLGPLTAGERMALRAGQNSVTWWLEEIAKVPHGTESVRRPD